MSQVLALSSRDGSEAHVESSDQSYYFRLDLLTSRRPYPYTCENKKIEREIGRKVPIMVPSPHPNRLSAQMPHVVNTTRLPTCNPRPKLRI